MPRTSTILALVLAAPLLAASGPASTAEPAPMRMKRPSTPASTAIEGNRTATQLLRVGHIPAVMATVNGEGPFLFAVDTGASGSLHLDAAFAERMGFFVVGEVIARDGMSGNEIPMPLLEVGTVEIGGATFEGIVGSSHDYSRIATALGSEMAGIIGFGLFADCVFTLDIPKNVLIIEDGVSLSPDEQGVVALADGGLIADVPIEIAGEQRTTHIDTGSRGGVTVAKDFFDSLEFSEEPKVIGQGRTVSSVFEIFQAPLDGTIRIAGHTVRKPPIQTTHIMDHGNVGMQLLSNFALTFDQRNGLMRFERPRGAGPLKIKEPKKRLGIVPAIKGSEMVLDAVMTGSPAHAAGLREGDKVVSINGRRIEELKGPALGEELAVRPSVVFVIERDGEERTVTVKMGS